MIKKGKEPVIEKLRIIQLIEVDLKLVIRIFLRNRNNGLIKKIIEFLSLTLVQGSIIQLLMYC